MAQVRLEPEGAFRIEVTGESLEAYDQEHILGPLGMVDTSYAVPKDKQSRVVKVYRHIDGAFQEQTFPVVPDKPTPPFRGDGGLYSTAQDYGRFMRMLLNGGRLGNVRIGWACRPAPGLPSTSYPLTARPFSALTSVSRRPRRWYL